MLHPFDRPLAQQLLDELAGRLSRSEIRIASLSYLRGLVKAARQGTFTPELALQVEAHRRGVRQHEQVVKRLEARSAELPGDGKMRENSPLAKRLLEIRDRAKQRQPQ